MNTSIKLSLDTRRMTQNGCFPIILRLTHFRKTTSIKTGHYVPEEYWDHHPSGFLLPIINRDILELQYKDAQWELRRYNIGLKEIAKKCGIEERLTSYVSRHSFATHAMFKKVPLEAISAMMGHNKLSTTQIYLKSLPSNILDSYQLELNSL
ncbi:tyrosine-type recombinase/integrase [uncultured Croceitalea sp.]|uniref:tyrosine-type recombinase/integrase n=1 Tax=uncultured Croceitalea sp. TaxID=1798908 RepID=UPI00330639AC